MADETTVPETPATETEAKAQPTAESKNAETPAEPMIPKARFDEVNNRLKALEADAAKKAKSDSEEQEKQLAAQAEWQKLADKRKAELEELTPQVELASKLTTLVTEQYAAEIKEWPEQVKAMAPADDASILAKLEWMAKAKPLALELMDEKPPIGGNGRRPTPVSPANTSKVATEQRAAWSRQARQRYK